MQTINLTQRILVNDPGKTQDGKTCERERAFINFLGHFQNLQWTQDNLSLHFQLGNMCHLLGCTAATEIQRRTPFTRATELWDELPSHVPDWSIICCTDSGMRATEKHLNSAVRYSQKEYGLQSLMSAVHFLENRANNLSLAVLYGLQY